MMPGLDDMIRSLRSISKLDERAATIAAPLLESALKATANAGTTPDGQPWAPRKKDGGRAMAGAASAISAGASGDTVRVTLRGPEVFWHFGERGAPRRQVIPDGGGEMPAVVSDVLKKSTAQAFQELTGTQS